ncbi:Zn-dependent protease [Pacificimonas flava]|uniref:Zn-dependent protease n=2 Tax=Pacificimonas TaxID=1960290 RepID=A0A219B2K3_9SPHN|nr:MULTISPECIES: metallopeptidase family protein [Pacificimonas]MBZ6377745.1 metallopeptidase family protein [Pacificimonas aurantium]OWV32580.1 Zn-dependent protease [Pacificimonas flava]
MTSGTFAPTLADIERLAVAAIDTLPDLFREHLGGVRLVVADFPDEDVIAEMELSSPFDILGLYHGHSIAKSVELSGNLPDTVYLYRRPLLDYWAEHEESLEHLVAHVLIHEVGHHFGLSDEDMHGIEDAAG